jgi:Flp pilus assembly protein TadD
VSESEAYDAFTRGHELLRSRDFHQASVALQRARRLEPDKASVREALGRAYMGCREFDRAREEFEAAVALGPTDGYAHFGLAKALERLGDRKLADRHFMLARCFQLGLG